MEEQPRGCRIFSSTIVSRVLRRLSFPVSGMQIPAMITERLTYSHGFLVSLLRSSASSTVAAGYSGRRGRDLQCAGDDAESMAAYLAEKSQVMRATNWVQQARLAMLDLSLHSVPLEEVRGGCAYEERPVDRCTDATQILARSSHAPHRRSPPTASSPNLQLSSTSTTFPSIFASLTLQVTALDTIATCLQKPARRALRKAAAMDRVRKEIAWAHNGVQGRDLESVRVGAGRRACLFAFSPACTGSRLVSEFLRYGCTRSFEDIFQSLSHSQGRNDDDGNASQQIIATLVRDFEAEIDDSVRLLESL